MARFAGGPDDFAWAAATLASIVARLLAADRRALETAAYHEVDRARNGTETAPLHGGSDMTGRVDDWRGGGRRWG